MCLIPSISRAQWSDTLKEVIIESPQWSDQNTSLLVYDFKENFSINPSVPNSYNALQTQFGLNSLNYGSSGIIAPRIRGTNPEHTALVWNGININHAGLGQSNGFNIPLVQGQNLQLAYGGGSVPFGSSAIAASILLNDDLSFKEKNELCLSASYGSFNTISSQAGFKKSDSRNSLRVNIYRVQSDNNFEYVNTSDFRRPTVRQNNSAFLQNGIQANFAQRLNNKHQIRFHSWIHDGYTEVQPTMSNRNSEDSQRDHFHRYKFSHLYDSRTGLLQTDLFYTSDDIEFNGAYSGIQRYGLRSSLNKKLTNFLNSGIGINYEYFLPDYANFPEKTDESRLSFYSFNTVTFGKLTAKINLRYTLIEGYKVPFTPNASVDYVLVNRDEKLLRLKASYSENFRLPTLNERYWVPGGNPDILPESSTQYEFGMETGKGLLKMELSYFHMDISNAVQWILKDSVWSGPGIIKLLYTDIYSPENINKVQTEGINSRLSLEKIQVGSFTLNSCIAYNYTKARDEERSGQRLYTPYHSLAVFAGLALKKYSFKSSYQFVSERNVSVGVLDPYDLLNLSISRDFKFKKHHINLAFQINNALDQTYQTFINRAMPGRNYLISIRYKLNLNENFN
ncbi:TonB-dependent receptor [Hyphobacterium sp. CCMP332]|nr:TonB-dependent receptor [Hyphobacterium sp. CCMP332]